MTLSLSVGVEELARADGFHGATVLVVSKYPRVAKHAASLYRKSGWLECCLF